MGSGHGTIDKVTDSGWEAQGSKWGWSMAMGPLRRKKTLVGRVRVFKWGWTMAMGPLKRKKALAGKVRVS